MTRRAQVRVPMASIARHRSMGNIGWFPGYPAAVRIASHALRVRPARAGRAEALLFELGLLTLLWTRLLPPVSRTARWLALLSAAFFPAWCYRHAVFPLSMTAFFALAAIVLAADQALLFAGACGARGCSRPARG